ncbi:MAG: hypothetical protein HY704_14950 [Gemmatimonadetes bacterium]|nr:hypothetical protein [Gemmatimonadota bacterium]
MGDYRRRTAITPAEALEKADEILPQRLANIQKVRASDHGATFSGPEGTVTISAHRHGPYTEVVASTNRLGTSRLDLEVQCYLNLLPYEPGDKPPSRVGR